MTPDENSFCSTQRLKPRHKAFILGNLGLKLNEGIILYTFFFFYLNPLCSEMRIKVFSLSKMQLSIYNCEKQTQPKCKHLEEQLCKLCYNERIYYVAIRSLFTKKFLIGWENVHDKMVSGNTI